MRVFPNAKRISQISGEKREAKLRELAQARPPVTQLLLFSTMQHFSIHPRNMRHSPSDTLYNRDFASQLRIADVQFIYKTLNISVKLIVIDADDNHRLEKKKQPRKEQVELNRTIVLPNMMFPISVHLTDSL